MNFENISFFFFFERLISIQIKHQNQKRTISTRTNNKTLFLSDLINLRNNINKLYIKLHNVMLKNYGINELFSKYFDWF